MENPWKIESMYELQFFNCPSCIFKDHSKQEILNHAFENHLESIECLKNIKDDSLKDVVLPWSENIPFESQNISKIKTEITVISISRNGLLKSCARFVIERSEIRKKQHDFKSVHFECRMVLFYMIWEKSRL